MEKIILVINAHHPDTRLMDFGCEMATMAKTDLTGLFVEHLAFTSMPIVGIGSAAYFTALREEAVANVKTDVDQAVRIFEDECERKGVACNCILGKGDPVDQVVFESRFADLLVVDPNIGFYERTEQIPSPLLKEILHRSECPVLLAPHEYEGIEEIVFCYDGSASAVFAIKHFYYLFPGLANRKATLLEISKKRIAEFDDRNRRLMSLMKTHYTHVTYRSEEGTGEDLFQFLFKQRKKMVVMGAFGRSMFSNLFKHSSAETLLRMTDLPVFITHH